MTEHCQMCAPAPFIPTIQFPCPLCAVKHVHDAVHTTLTLDDELLLWLVARCPTTGSTIRTRMGKDFRRQILMLPVLVDPDVVDYLPEILADTQSWAGPS